MNSNQKGRFNQITSSTLIVGGDIAKFKHVARAQDNRGIEFGKPITFENTMAGFETFVSWFQKISMEHRFRDVIVGMKPTGHYWLNLAYFLREKQVKYGVVNPLHVKRAKSWTTIRRLKMTSRMRKSLHSWSKTGDTPYRAFLRVFMQN